MSAEGKKEYTLMHVVLSGVGGAAVGLIAGVAAGPMLMEAIDENPVKTAEENLARARADAAAKKAA